jgi:hypothetical protein
MRKFSFRAFALRALGLQSSPVKLYLMWQDLALLGVETRLAANYFVRLLGNLLEIPEVQLKKPLKKDPLNQYVESAMH